MIRHNVWLHRRARSGSQWRLRAPPNARRGRIYYKYLLKYQPDGGAAGCCEECDWNVAWEVRYSAMSLLGGMSEGWVTRTRRLRCIRGQWTLISRRLFKKRSHLRSSRMTVLFMTKWVRAASRNIATHYVALWRRRSVENRKGGLHGVVDRVLFTWCKVLSHKLHRSVRQRRAWHVWKPASKGSGNDVIEWWRNVSACVQCRQDW